MIVLCMSISHLHQGKFQKSKTFLFPAIGVRKNSHTANITTFISWKDRYRKEDHRLIAVKYGGINNPEYSQFESLNLLTKTMLENKYFINEETIVYVFNFEAFAPDWNWFLQGKYSRLSETLKHRIQQYYGIESIEWEYVKTFLYPKEHFERYAELLFDPNDYALGLERIRSVGELCDHYDPEQEMFTVIPKMSIVRANSI